MARQVGARGLRLPALRPFEEYCHFRKSVRRLRPARRAAMDTPITFASDGLTLAGDLHIPDGHVPGRKLPAFIVLHGFIGSKDRSHAEIMARLMESFGYAVLRFD